MTAVSLSSDAEYKRGFGPMLPGIKLIPYGDIEALEAAITPNTAAFLIEPIQGEAGIIIPPAGFMKAACELCKKHNVLFIADEIQAGLCRTGKMFACEWEDIEPDMYILGKALRRRRIPNFLCSCRQRYSWCIQSRFTWFNIWWKSNGMCSFNCIS